MTEIVANEATFGLVFAEFKDDLVHGFAASQAIAQRKGRFDVLSTESR
ncbi:MAG: hypothetical protein KJ072_27140 [Verrucomicrobia bacterium]|nr:hypothetical protein [Verrucomicrobiota bacterium]